VQKFFSTLFDLSFNKFVTPQLVTYIYIISIVSAGITSIFAMKALPLGFILAPLLFITNIVFIRAGLELVLAVFQIARYSAEIARRGRVDEPPAVDTELSPKTEI